MKTKTQSNYLVVAVAGLALATSALAFAQDTTKSGNYHGSMMGQTSQQTTQNGMHGNTNTRPQTPSNSMHSNTTQQAAPTGMHDGTTTQHHETDTSQQGHHANQ